MGTVAIVWRDGSEPSAFEGIRRLESRNEHIILVFEYRSIPIGWRFIASLEVTGPPVDL